VEVSDPLFAPVLPESLLPESLLPEPLLLESLLPESLLPESLLPESLLPESLLPESLLELEEELLLESLDEALSVLPPFEASELLLRP
jgi:hypothetical protein